MATYYAESSVLVKRHVPEVGSAWVKALTEPSAGHAVLTAHLSLVEIYSALNRRVRELAAAQAEGLSTDNPNHHP